jgi:hypothetical protein
MPAGRGQARCGDARLGQCSGMSPEQDGEVPPPSGEHLARNRRLERGQDEEDPEESERVYRSSSRERPAPVPASASAVSSPTELV